MKMSYKKAPPLLQKVHERGGFLIRGGAFLTGIPLIANSASQSPVSSFCFAVSAVSGFILFSCLFALQMPARPLDEMDRKGKETARPETYTDILTLRCSQRLVAD